MANSLLYDQWFGHADEDGDGRLTGPDAVKFFARSGLGNDVLANIWALADSKKRGYLDRNAFHQALDLIAIAQQGEPVTRDAYAAALLRGVPTPTIHGLGDSGPADAGSNPYGVPSGRDSLAGSSSSSLHSQGSGRATNGGGGGWPIPTAPPPPSRPPSSRAKPVAANVCTSVVDGLKHIYFSKVKPLEEQFKFGHFFSPLLHESDFEAKPSILLLGQYSTGKTTFCKYLLGRDFPGCHIGPEPTTDRFLVVHHGSEDRRIPGNTLAVQPDKPYQGLSHFGTGFLSRFEGSQCNAPLLQEVTLVDTPGVLSGEKQRIDRNYNFLHVVQWFAARCDLILLLFDPYKLDISDEFKQVIDTLKGHDDKVRVVLNKADMVDSQQLMRVYGALMWSLGKCFKSPEVCRVYIGSFNSEAPISLDKNPHGAELFVREQEDLMNDLRAIPQRSCDRKVNEFVKRVRAARIHLLLLGHLRKQMPTMFGREKAQRKVLEELADHFRQVQREHHLPPGDFPDLVRFREILSGFDLTTFPKVTKAMTKAIEDALSVDIPNLVRTFDNPYG